MVVAERDRRSLFVIAAAAAALAALCVVTIDQPVARWLAGRDTAPAIWDRGISIVELVSGIEPWKWIGTCVVGAGVIATLALRRYRHLAPAWLFVAITHFLARNLMLWTKTFTGRLRPSEWLARGGDTFFRDGGISFPSGHVIYVASLALPIAIVWPRSRPAVAVVVAFTMVARVVVDAHFISDVVAGLALAAVVTWLGAAAVRPLAAPSPTPPASPG
jgi:undecaprenyl-diphosphatase